MNSYIGLYSYIGFFYTFWYHKWNSSLPTVESPKISYLKTVRIWHWSWHIYYISQKYYCKGSYCYIVTFLFYRKIHIEFVRSYLYFNAEERITTLHMFEKWLRLAIIYGDYMHQAKLCYVLQLYYRKIIVAVNKNSYTNCVHNMALSGLVQSRPPSLTHFFSSLSTWSPSIAVVR